MFYYRLTVKRRTARTSHRQDRAMVTDTLHREYGSTREVGETVAALLGEREVRSVHVGKINQAAYIAATRGGE